MTGPVAVDGYEADELVRLGGADREDPRSPFARDYDRLIYTAQFRRLQGKTQVVTAGEADFFRTRLTHTIEVAQVARRLAEALNRSAYAFRRQRGIEGFVASRRRVNELDAACQIVDPDLCEAAAILHDLGHPPFAHAGEMALNSALNAVAEQAGIDSVGGFEGNAQSFRLATSVLSHHGSQRGLQLTLATLDACLKYPWTAGTAGAPKPDKWSAYPTEDEALALVRARAPGELRFAASLEAQIMDWADDVAYSIHDLEDWYRAGYVPLPRLAELASEQDRFVEFVVARWQSRSDPRATNASELSTRIRDEVLGPDFDNPLSAFRDVPRASGSMTRTPALAEERSAAFAEACSTTPCHESRSIGDSTPATTCPAGTHLDSGRSMRSDSWSTF